MTVQTDVREFQFEGNDLATEFGFGCKVFSEVDVLVIKTDSAGNETTLVKDLDYTVALNANQDDDPGGTVTYPISGAPLAAGEKLTITTDIEETQGTKLPNASAWFPKVIENALDKVTILVQQLRGTLNRSLRQPVSDAARLNDIPTAAQRRGKVLAFTNDAEAQPIAQAVVPTSGVVATAFAETLLDDLDVVEARGTLGVYSTAESDANDAALEAELRTDLAPKDSPSLTGTPTAPTAPTGNNGTQIANAEWVNNHAGRTVRQTALFGHVDSNGYADFLTTGSGLRPGLLASAVNAIFSYSNGMQEVVEQITADNADILGANLPASNTSFIYKDRGGAYGSTLVPPQYGYAFDRTKGIVANFDGANGATSALDEFGNTITFGGNAALDTAVKKFGTASLNLDGTGDYVKFTDVTQWGDGSWELIFWFNADSLTGDRILISPAGTAFSLKIYCSTAGGARMVWYLSDNGSSDNVVSGGTGTTALNTGVWYRVRVHFDATANSYRLFLSINGAAEVLELSHNTSQRLASITGGLQLGLNSAGSQGFDGHIDALSFKQCISSASPETPSASAPAITDYPYHFFSIPEMKMYEVTGASSAAGSNPTMTQRYRLFLGECDTGAASITAARTYALRGEYMSTPEELTLAALKNYNHNIGALPLTMKLYCRIGSILSSSDYGNTGEQIEFDGFTFSDQTNPRGGSPIYHGRCVTRLAVPSNTNSAFTTSGIGNSNVGQVRAGNVFIAHIKRAF